MSPLFTGSEWTFDLIQKSLEIVEDIGKHELGMNLYPNQVEIISAEQMLDAYSSVGMPVMYNHWSYGKRLVKDQTLYKKGHMGLALEIIINSNPCIAYLMEENSMTMQLLTLAHACVSGDTEYLSPTGWKRFDEYDGGKVAQYHDNEKISFTTPLKYIKRDQSDFIHINSEKISQMITDDHTVIAVNGNGNIVKLTGKEVERRQQNKTRGFNCRFITGFYGDNNTKLPLTDDEIRLHIAIKADGSIINPDVDKSHFAAKELYTIRFHLKKERKINRLKNILQILNISYKETLYNDNTTDIKFDYDKISKRFSTDWYSASYEQLQLIGEEVCYWDGSISGSNHTYSSAFKEDADFVQYVWSATNNHAHIQYATRVWNVIKSNRTLISLSKHGKNGRLPPMPFDRVPSSDGKAYCFTVETNMLIIRHDNKISVTGNCVGHNYVFANNYMFKDWTDADSIIDYLIFAKKYIRECEEQYGFDEVEKTLDSLHALQNLGVNKYRRPSKLNAKQEAEKLANRLEEYSRTQTEMWYHLESKSRKKKPVPSRVLEEPEENILYFIEKNSPILKPWQRELVRIVRKISQYFYPQRYTKILNEGQASFCHYWILNHMYDKGLINDGSMMEWLSSHANVVYQPSYDSKHYSGINPYALGFAIFKDIQRIATNPTEEDRIWFPKLANADWKSAMREAATEYRDDSFVAQWLSPKVARDLKLFGITDDKSDDNIVVNAIHNEQTFVDLRSQLSAQYDVNAWEPNILVVDADLKNTRTLSLEHRMTNGRKLDSNTKMMLEHIKRLWGFPVVLKSVDISGKTIQTF